MLLPPIAARPNKPCRSSDKAWAADVVPAVNSAAAEERAVAEARAEPEISAALDKASAAAEARAAALISAVAEARAAANLVVVGKTPAAVAVPEAVEERVALEAGPEGAADTKCLSHNSPRPLGEGRLVRFFHRLPCFRIGTKQKRGGTSDAKSHPTFRNSYRGISRR
jgi:hypothetical protein